MTRLRVVIADDQPMMRAGFKAVLEATGDIQVVAEASTGTEAVNTPPMSCSWTSACPRWTASRRPDNCRASAS